MNAGFENIDDLIGKVLAGEATAGESREVQTWCKQKEDNQEYFDQLKAIFERAAANPVMISFDTDAAWLKVKTKLKKEKISYWPVIRLAAGVVLALSAIIYGYQWFNQPTQTLAVVSDQTTVQDTLPDGSTAFLNKKSSITFEYNQRGKTRNVKLKGEGFFEVKHEEEKPFVIEAEETLIRDLGTSFNVKAYADADTVEVVVQSGIVQFYTLKDPGVLLNAGETGLYTKRGKFFTKIQKADTNVLAYKTGIFSFHATDLRSVIDRINEVYGSQINLANEKLGECELTVSFKNEDINTIVEVIAETMSLTIERNEEGQIILNGTGCQ